MSLNIITVTLNMGESAGHSQTPVLGKTAHMFCGLEWDLRVYYKALGSMCSTGRKTYAPSAAVVLL